MEFLKKFILFDHLTYLVRKLMDQYIHSSALMFIEWSDALLIFIFKIEGKIDNDLFSMWLRSIKLCQCSEDHI